MDDFEASADHLYGLPLDEFVQQRDRCAAEARRAKDRALGKRLEELAKPTQAAWLVNRLVRQDRARMDRFLQLGEDLRKAQETLEGTALRELAGRRRVWLHKLVEDAGPTSPAVREELESTLSAALADPDVAAQVRAGRLTRGLRFSGFGTLAGTLQAAPRKPRPAVDPEKLRQAEERAEEAARDLETAEARVQELRAQWEELRAQLEESESALDRAVQKKEKAEQALGIARRKRDLVGEDEPR